MPVTKGGIQKHLSGGGGVDATALKIAQNLADLNSASTARTNLGLGDAATKTVGVANGNVIMADATGLPAIDGSQLTGISSSTDGWTQEVGTYTATPASPSRITMSDTSNMTVGSPLKITNVSTTRYVVVDAISANAHIDVRGSSMSTGASWITGLYIGQPTRVLQVDFFVSGTYGDGTDSTLLLNDMNSFFNWNLPPASLCSVKMVQAGVDTGTEPKVNLSIGAVNDRTIITDTSAGLQLVAAATWVETGLVEINPTYCDITTGEQIELYCTAAGGTGDAANLTVSARFVIH